MNDTMDEIRKVLSKAAIDGTLTEDAISQFSAVIDENRALHTDYESTLTHLKDSRAETKKVLAERDEYYKQLAVWQSRETELATREKEILRLELTAEFSEKRLSDCKELFTTVFRNSVLRREVMTPIRGTEGVDQYNAPLAGGYASKDEVKETEE